MWPQNYVPYPYIIVPIMIITTTCHTPKNNTDVIITYSNHAEAENNVILNEDVKTTEKTATKKESNNRRGQFDSPVNIITAKHAELEYDEVVTTTTTTTTEAPLKGREEKMCDRRPIAFSFVTAKIRWVKIEILLVDESHLVSAPLQWKTGLYDMGNLISPAPTEPMSSDEGVVFVPNERRVMRNEDYLQPQPKPLLIKDILNNHQTIKDVLGTKEIKLETENPLKEDIIFISGKNKPKEEKEEKPVEKKKKYNLHEETELIETESVTKKAIVPKLDCKNLNCNNSIESLCGAKLERNQWKYRLFLNDCFFRKVNCYFKNKENRYKKVKLENCKTIGVHLSERPQLKRDRRRQMPEPVEQIDETRRANARRSSTLNMNGQLCDHPCPSSCPENYDPECAISEEGHKKVFVNHCQMDLNSCIFGIVWQRRPLADCVGGKKADMQQNRGFIHWMQSVGIVDKKGRLNLN